MQTHLLQVSDPSDYEHKLFYLKLFIIITININVYVQSLLKILQNKITI